MNEYDDAPTNVQGPPPVPGRPLSPDQKSAIAAALVGTAALGGAAYGMAQYLDDSNVAVIQEDTSDNDASGGDTTPSDPTSGHKSDDLTGLQGVGLLGQTGLETLPIQTVAHVSEQNREDMTFEDAFREARGEMGPGHYFEWHNQLYNTFYQDEWGRMSQGEHQEFLASVYGDDPSGMPQGSVVATSSGSSAVEHNVNIDDVPPDADITVDDAGTDLVAHADHTSGNVTVEAKHEGGDHIQSLSAEADIAVTDWDGHEVSVFDIDHDDRPDAVMINDNNVVLIDTDHDHVLDTQAVYNPENHHLSDFQDMNQHMTIDGSMEILHHSDTHSESNLAGDIDFGLDFDSNADISDFAS